MIHYGQAGPDPTGPFEPHPDPHLDPAGWPPMPPPPDQPDEPTRRIAYANAPAWAIEAGWERPPEPDDPLGLAEAERLAASAAEPDPRDIAWDTGELPGREAIDCRHCHGEGYERTREGLPCPVCGGRGYL